MARCERRHALGVGRRVDGRAAPEEEVDHRELPLTRGAMERGGAGQVCEPIDEGGQLVNGAQPRNQVRDLDPNLTMVPIGPLVHLYKVDLSGQPRIRSTCNRNPH